VNYAFFSRDRYTESAISLANEHGAQLIDLDRLDQELREAQDSFLIFGRI
jgi:hypothetical protein